jgi:hypothetical protein
MAQFVGRLKQRINDAGGERQNDKPQQNQGNRLSKPGTLFKDGYRQFLFSHRQMATLFSFP